MTINIRKDFSSSPGPRYINEGRFSGEEFRKNVLYPKMIEAIDSNSTIEVVLDGTAGFATSFLEESFGGLIRENKLDYNLIMSTLRIISHEEEYLVDDINQYLKEAFDEVSKS